LEALLILLNLHVGTNNIATRELGITTIYNKLNVYLFTIAICKEIYVGKTGVGC
jgi:hypothetical protein